jgi:DNA-binding protein YbaB
MSRASEDMLRSFQVQAMEQAERAQQLSRRMQQTSVTVESPGGEVRVTVDSTGGLSGLDFGAAAERVRLDRLAELVLQTSRLAQGRLAGSMNELVDEVYGRGSDTASFVSQAYAERFPEPEPEPDDRGGRR